MTTDNLIADTALRMRPLEAGDDEFLYHLYASTRAAEMTLVPWTAEQKEAFLRMQLQAQTTHYRGYYPNAVSQVIQHDDGSPIGRLIVDRSDESILIIDIALLPQYRSAGIGSRVLRMLMAEAGQAALPLVLRVEFFNPAIRLYSRLGFVKTRQIDIYHEMVWTAERGPRPEQVGAGRPPGVSGGGL